MELSRLAIGILLLLMPCLAGCASEDTGTVVRENPGQRQQEAAARQAQAEKIKNDPHIPEAQKQAILARMGQGGGAKPAETEADVKNRMIKQAPPAGNKP